MEDTKFRHDNMKDPRLLLKWVMALTWAKMLATMDTTKKHMNMAA